MQSTTDPTLRSFIEVEPTSHFPIQNLPYGVFRRDDGEVHIGTAIGDWVLDLTALEAKGEITESAGAFRSSSLNTFMAMGRTVWMAVRARISQLLHIDERHLRDNQALRDEVLLPHNRIEMLLPVAVGDYTDFYSSKYHATNVGTMLRGADNALQPNWVHLPVAYHGRASSLVPSGTGIRRPSGQRKPTEGDTPAFGPTKALDFELEMGAFVGPGTELGEPIPIENAEDHLFGMVLVNDWSARDIQGWEYVPLGPFLSKSFATTLSPWVVTMEALEPFRCDGPEQEPTPLPYLQQAQPRSFNIHLSVHLQTANSGEEVQITDSNFEHLYWSVAQQLAHHTVNGCNVHPGDLLASGTISGPTKESRGCMLELTWRGSEPISIGEEQRSFLLDGDTVVMSGWCQGVDYRVGFGECRGSIVS